MTILVATETTLLAIVTLLVVGLLRSHAEILRRLDPEAGVVAPYRPAGVSASSAGTAAHDIDGVTLSGDAQTYGCSAVDRGPTLLAFLSSGCAACQPFLEAFRDQHDALRNGVAVLVVTHDPDRENTQRLRRLTGASPVLCSSSAWHAYGVVGSPYFVLVEHGIIRGEGVTGSPAELAAFIADTTPDPFMPPAAGTGRSRSTHTDADEALRRGGIEAGHPSLYGAGGGAA